MRHSAVDMAGPCGRRRAGGNGPRGIVVPNSAGRTGSKYPKSAAGAGRAYDASGRAGGHDPAEGIPGGMDAGIPLPDPGGTGGSAAGGRAG